MDGRRWSADGPPKQKNPPKQKSPPKPRRGKPIIDPKKGMVISEAAAKVLIADGASDARKKPPCEVYVDRVKPPNRLKPNLC